MHFMKKLSFNLIILLFPLIAFVGCEDVVEDSPILDDQKYFPLTVGKWQIYEADSIVWNSFTETVETIKFQIREEVIDSFIDGSNRSAVKIERTYRSNANQVWNNADTWYAVRDEKVAERVENNLRFTKLAFPIVAGAQWKGNGFVNNVFEFNICKNWNYTITQTDATFATDTTTNTSFNDVVEVTQIDLETGLSKCFSKEYYAPNIGLISKSMILLQLSDPNETIPWEEKVNRGYIYNQNLIDHN